MIHWLDIVVSEGTEFCSLPAGWPGVRSDIPGIEGRFCFAQGTSVKVEVKMGGGGAGAQTRVLSCVNLQPNSPAQQGGIRGASEEVIVGFTHGTLRVMSADEAK